MQLRVCLLASRALGLALAFSFLQSVVVLKQVAAQTASETQSSAPTADNDEIARNVFQAGKTAFATGQFEDALRYFEEAYARSARPELQYNIGIAADRLRQDEKAVAAFEAYLARVPAAENRAEVEARIRALKKARADQEAAAARPALLPAARDAPANASSGDFALTQPDDETKGRSLTQRWWFWTSVGAVVAGGVVVALALSSNREAQASPIESRSGVTIMTLRTR